MGKNLTLPALLAVAVPVLLSAAPAHELELGAPGPSFTLKGTDGAEHSLADFVGHSKATVVVFTCNHCPFAKGYEDRLIKLAQTYQPQGIAFVAINPNDPKIAPDDSFDKMVERAKEKGFPYPYLYDETQEIARAYGAQVTPHVFVLDADGNLIYRGRVDNSVKIEEVTDRDLQNALDAVVAGRPVPVASTKAFGCSVKYRG
jgi:peroxiredoxin